MTISALPGTVEYGGDGVTTTFIVPFEFFQPNDIRARKYPDINDRDIYEDLAYGTQYLVTGGDGGVGQAQILTSPIPSGAAIEFSLNMPLGQTVPYPKHDPFPARAHETALDRLAVQIKQVSLRAKEKGSGPAPVTSVFGRQGDVVALPVDYAAFYSDIAHVHTWSDIGNKPVVFPPEIHSHSWPDIDDKPTVFPPTAHTHPWGEIVNRPVTFPPDPHTHLWAHLTDKPAVFPAAGSYPYDFSPTTSEVDPGQGYVAVNNTIPGSVSKMFISRYDALGNDLGPLLEGYNLIVNDTRGRININTEKDQSRLLVFNVDNKNVVDHDGWFTIEVSPVVGTSSDMPEQDDRTHTALAYSANRGSGATDPDAIHKNVANEFTGITEQSGTHSDDDMFILERAADGEKIKVRRSELPSAPAQTVQSVFTRTGHIVAVGTDYAAFYRGKTDPVAWADLTGVPTEFPPQAHTHVWADLTDKPTEFPPEAHTHVIGDVTGLQTALDGKAPTAHTHDAANIVTGRLNKDRQNASTVYLDTAGQNVTGGCKITELDLGATGSGTRTLNLGSRGLQRYSNTGGHALNPGNIDGAAIITITNASGAGAINFTGWDHVGGDDLTTTNGHKFRIHCTRAPSGKSAMVEAMQ